MSRLLFEKVIKKKPNAYLCIKRRKEHLKMIHETTNETPKYIFRGEIYMVDFREGEGESVHYGKRPCLVISNDIGNRYSSIVNVCLLTTKVMKRDYPTHLKLEPNAMNKLRQESIAMFEQVRTIGKEKLGFKIGKLTDEEIHKMDEVLKITFGIQ